MRTGWTSVRTMRCVAVAALVLCAAGTLESKTRWSSLRMVPDSDLLPTGDFVVSFDGFLGKSMDIAWENHPYPESTWVTVVDTITSYDTAWHDSLYPIDTTTDFMFRQTYLLRMSIAEWVNVHLGWADGFTLGFKARILGETSRGMPSLAIGVHNIFNHKEVNYFGYKSDIDINNEFFIAIGKTIEPMKMRIHGGVQTMPTNEREVFNPFFAVEKYFGFGLYTSLEVHRRDLLYHASLFASMRALEDRLEFSAGAVSLETMFFDQNENFSVSLAPRSPTSFVGPGIWLGIRFHSRLGLGKRGGFASTEDRIQKQNETIEMLRGEVDSLKSDLDATYTIMQNMSGVIGTLTDSSEYLRVREDVLHRLRLIKGFYTAEEEFNPDSVQFEIFRIKRYGELGLSALKDILLDEKEDGHVRQYSVMVIGELGDQSAAGTLRDLLARTMDPNMKIEILIALGKLKDTSAMYLMENLANDPNDAVAMTAQDVLRRLAEQTGARISPKIKMRDLEQPQQPSETIPESKIGTGQSDAVPDTPLQQGAAPARQKVVESQQGEGAEEKAAATSDAPQKEPAPDAAQKKTMPKKQE